MKEVKEITVQEFAEAVNGGVYRVESEDTYGIHVGMPNAAILYDADFDELTFKSGLAEIRFNVPDCIEGITVDESGAYTIEFHQYMSDVLVLTTKTIRKVVG